MKNIISEFRAALICTFLLGVLLCGVYPATVWIHGQGLFPEEANGSLVVRHGKIAGSSLLSQRFSGSKYFHPRPSSAGEGHDATKSGGSNLGPLSQKLFDTVRQRISEYRAENNLGAGTAVPADAVTASGSGLDPHISPQNALIQAPRVAAARGMRESEVRRLITERTEGRDMFVFGEPRVNVLMLNLDLDDYLETGNGKQG